MKKIHVRFLCLLFLLVLSFTLTVGVMTAWAGPGNCCLVDGNRGHWSTVGSYTFCNCAPDGSMCIHFCIE